MKIIGIEDYYNEEVVLVLGFFDGIHKGHRELLAAANRLCVLTGLKLGVFTFTNDVQPYSKSKGDDCIYTFIERAAMFKEMGVNLLVTMELNEQASQLSPEEFLRMLKGQKNIVHIFSGMDYTYGKDGAGDVALLKSFCGKRDVGYVDIAPTIYAGKKISTTTIKELLRLGDIKAANKLLVQPFSILGQVVAGRQEARTMGFPTANMNYPKGKVLLSEGVYVATIEVHGKMHKGLVSVGGKPTFNIKDYTVEAYIDGFEGDIYGEIIKINFFEKLRDIMRFKGKRELKKQITVDKKVMRKFDFSHLA